AGTAVLIFAIIARLFRGKNDPPRADVDAGERLLTFGYKPEIWAAIAALTWAFYLPAQAFSIVAMPTTLGVFAFWLVVAVIVNREQPPTLAGWFLLGALVGITAMGVATILFLIPLLLFAILRRWAPVTKGKTLRQLAGAAILLAGVASGTAPCWLHNTLVAHDPVFLSAHSGVNLWIGNNPDATGYPHFGDLPAAQRKMLDASITRAEAAAGRPLKRSEVSAFWSAKARGYISGHLAAWLRLLGVKMWNFWNAFQYDDLSVVSKLREQGIIFAGPRFGIVAAAALAAIPFVLRRWKDSRWILGAILLQMLALLPVFVTERYRLAAVPGLIILAVLGLSHFWECCVARRVRPAVFYAALLVFAALLVSSAPTDPGLWALDPYNAGREALDGGDLPRAQQKLELAHAYVPQNPEINLALGNLWLARGNPERARQSYIETLRAQPGHKAALSNLGVLAWQEKQLDRAAGFFRAAIAIAPDDAKTHYLLASALLGAGRQAEAQAEADIAVKLQPDQPEFADLQRRVRSDPAPSR
ncbi:MAG: tetratricopeptide repeat protein, partial [Verrucomicrobiota bacterium]|nr:tetratricopeptide repeat protein [Verrucomicrobiota bacterium]